MASRSLEEEVGVPIRHNGERLETLKNPTVPPTVEESQESWTGKPREETISHTHKVTHGPEAMGFLNFEDLTNAYFRLHEINPYHPNRRNLIEERELGHDDRISELEVPVKRALGNKIKADTADALMILTLLFREGVKADGLKISNKDSLFGDNGEITKFLKGDHDFKDYFDLSDNAQMRIQEFYNRAAGATGVESIKDFVEDIMNMKSARPGHLWYNSKDSALGKLIAWVAGQMNNPIGNKDNNQRRVAYVTQQIMSLGKDNPLYTDMLLKRFNKVLPQPLKRTANVSKMLEEYNKQVLAPNSQLYEGTLPKTHKYEDTFQKTRPFNPLYN